MDGPRRARSTSVTRAVREGRSWPVAVLVATAFVAATVVLHPYLTRPFWYDEIWRAHFVSESSSAFWDELGRANTPSALGWIAVTRASGELLGWYSWALRLPGFAALPLLAGAVVLLARRSVGPAAAVFTARWTCAGATFLDLGTQLKPYTVEALAAVVTLLLWSHGPDPDVPGGAARRRRIGLRTAAGFVALFAVPSIFVIVPLAVVDGCRSWAASGVPRSTTRRLTARLSATVATLAEAAPAVSLAGIHTWLFLGHQSSQRLGTYWDAHFLSGRGTGDAVAFVLGELGRTYGRTAWDRPVRPEPGPRLGPRFVVVLVRRGPAGRLGVRSRSLGAVRRRAGSTPWRRPTTTPLAWRLSPRRPSGQPPRRPPVPLPGR